jgi:methylenetetrahydrofolate reductase (NADPH)
MTMTTTAAPTAPINLRNIRAAARHNTPAEIARDLVRSGSLEMGADRPKDARAIADLLPTGTPVFVNHLPKHALSATLAGLEAAANTGLEPVPHLAARRIASRDEAASFLKAAHTRAGVTKLLLLGGDTAKTAGPYPDALALLNSGLIAEAGIREVAFAGYPEGHPTVDADTMIDALDAKLASAHAQGLGVRVITQFSFAPARILDFCVWLHRRAPHVPVQVGIPGPTSPASLIRYATICGVGASFRAMTNQGMGAVKLLTHTDPGEQLAMIAAHQRSNPHTNITGIHMFSFGGVAKTAQWMNGVLRG